MYRDTTHVISHDPSNSIPCNHNRLTSTFVNIHSCEMHVGHVVPIIVDTHDISQCINTIIKNHSVLQYCNASFHLKYKELHTYIP